MTWKTNRSDALYASKPKKRNLSLFEAQMLKYAEDATTRLTELWGSWRSMDSALLLSYVSQMASQLTAIADALLIMNQKLECVTESALWISNEITSIKQLLATRSAPKSNLTRSPESNENRPVDLPPVS